MKCLICGNDFIQKKTSNKYCSKDCAYKSELLKAREKRNENRIILVKKCLICGDEFTPNIRTPYQIYCSDPCLRQSEQKRAVETGKKKEQYYKHKEKYAEKKSETDLNYKDKIRFSSNKKHVLERDGHKCVDCGKTTGLIVHHKDGSGSSENPNNDMGNLVTLCRSCHMRHHSGENNGQFIHLTKEQIFDARRESSSWNEVAHKLGVDRSIVFKRKKMYGIF